VSVYFNDWIKWTEKQFFPTDKDTKTMTTIAIQSALCGARVPVTSTYKTAISKALSGVGID